MTIITYQLSLKPDDFIPRFQRLQIEKVEVSIEEVFRMGLHPHSVLIQEGLAHATRAEEKLLNLLNDDGSCPADLKTHRLCPAVTTGGFYRDASGQVKDWLEGALRLIATTVYFAENLTYPELVKIATGQLRSSWSHALARDMVRDAGGDFAGVRDFLKRKDPGICVTGYESLNSYDLSQIISVDDLLTEDGLLIHYGIPTPNFRNASVLGRFVDDQGRLRLAPSIRSCVVTWNPGPPKPETEVTYHCQVESDDVTWRPDLKPDEAHRRSAREVASRIVGTPAYCFSSTLDQLDAVLNDAHFQLQFPDLRYSAALVPSVPQAKVQLDRVAYYNESSALGVRLINEDLKEALRTFHKKTCGTKGELVRRLAELLVEEYEAHRTELDRFFTQNRFVRLSAQSGVGSTFPVLTGHPLRSAVVILYCLRHLRGNVILEARHENQSVPLTDLAEAWLRERVTLTGTFYPVE